MEEKKEKKEKKAPAPKKAHKGKSFRSRARGKLVFAFDFGEFAVKVAVLKIRKDDVEVRHLFTVENPENLTKPDASNIKAWRARIQRVFSKHNVLTDNQLAVCTVGGKYYIHRQMEMPACSENDRKGLAENEMSQLLSLDPSNYVFQSELVSVTERDDGNRERVWTTAMQKETCEAIYELIRSLKLRPAVMDIHANGIRRVMLADEILQKESAGKTVVCVDYGMTHTEINFIRDGKILAETLLDVGDGRLVAEAKNALSVRVADPANYNKLTVSPQEVYGIMAKTSQSSEARSFSVSVEDWLSSVNTAISRFNFEHPDAAAARIYLYGGSPQLVWLSQYVANLTKLPSSVLSRSALFDTESVFGSKQPNLSGFINVLSLGLME